MRLTTALDAGCGPGFFTKLLSDCGLQVQGFDGRAVNTTQASQRYPNIPFDTYDVEDASVLKLGVFDLVLCFGLLYDLESPLRAIRHLQSLTGKVLVLESMVIPGKESIVLLREEPKSDDQSLTDLAFYPSERCIVKMLYGPGFRGCIGQDHCQIMMISERRQNMRRARTVLVASYEPITLPALTV